MPIALQYRMPPLLWRTFFAIALAIFILLVFKFILYAMSGLRAPIATTPAVGCGVSGPKSDFHSVNLILSDNPSNSPLLRSEERRVGKECRSLWGSDQ